MDPWDWMMRAQSQLLSKLFDLIVSRELSLESLECRDLEIWRAENIEIIGTFNYPVGDTRSMLTSLCNQSRI